MAFPQTALACDVAAQVFDQRGQHFGHCVPRVRIEPAPESQARPFFRSLHFFTGCYSVTDVMGLKYAGLGQVVTLSLGPLAFGPMDPVVRSPSHSPPRS
jgi:hypothetical protein